MNLLISPWTDVNWNLATEEYLLKNSEEDYIFLYINRPCVVVGKHQNALKEINSTFNYDNNIQVARRLSGGGAVFHDEGNLNFSFIHTVSPGDNFTYQNLTYPIIKCLQQMNPEIVLSQRNDLLFHDKKISGSAMHVFKNRVLAHGTLLTNCNLQHLSSSLKGHPERYTDKSIASNRADVMNLSQQIKGLTSQALLVQFRDYMAKTYRVKTCTLSVSDVQCIDVLAFKKYCTNEWIFGYSPKYVYENSILYEGKQIKFGLVVEKGTIVSVTIYSTNDITRSNINIINSLQGKQHNYKILFTLLMTLSNDAFEASLMTSLF
jgi:lipoate-protein ligase A